MHRGAGFFPEKSTRSFAAMLSMRPGGNASREVSTHVLSCWVTCILRRSFSWLPASGADGRGYKLATPEAVRFFNAATVQNRRAWTAVIITVGAAMRACDKEGFPAPLLAAMAGIAELQPYTAPSLPQAQRLLATPSGWHAYFPPSCLACVGVALPYSRCALQTDCAPISEQ